VGTRIILINRDKIAAIFFLIPDNIKDIDFTKIKFEKENRLIGYK
jgi:hypothetical protein